MWVPITIASSVPAEISVWSVSTITIPSGGTSESSNSRTRTSNGPVIQRRLPRIRRPLVSHEALHTTSRDTTTRTSSRRQLPATRPAIQVIRIVVESAMTFEGDRIVKLSLLTYNLARQWDLAKLTEVARK